VTGGIGAGKTTVCAEFERLGRKVLYADLLARQLQESDRGIRRKVTSLIGREAYLDDGRLNRPFISDAIFSDEQLRKGMNDIVHPVVIRSIERTLKTDSSVLGEPYLLIEAALIYESGLDKKLDAILLVDAPLEERVGRVSRRDKLSHEKVLARMRSQESTQKLRLKAEFVLLNTGDIGDIRANVCFLDSIFRQI
jgi:dephospho-CoA kinase